MEWTIEHIPSQAGRLAIVTGGSGGLGLETARALAVSGADVIVAARDPRKASMAVSEIGRGASFEHLDLADLASIKAFSEGVIRRGRPVDILINNAGLASPPKRATTRDGFEKQFGTNFLGHFALTGRLLAALRAATSPRVVTVSSIMHKAGRINFDDLMSDRRYSPVASYSQSKLANLMFAFELHRRAETEGWGLASIAAHPGMARTDLIKSRPGQPVLAINHIAGLIFPLFTGTAPEGALPTLFAATSPDAKPGAYYGPTGFGEIKGPTGPARASARSLDAACAAALWREAERLTQISF